MDSNEDAGRGDPNSQATAPASGPTWYEPPHGEFTCADWQHELGRDVPIDPYLVWADLSHMAGFGGPNPDGSDGTWPLLVELEKEVYTLPATPGVAGHACSAAAPASPPVSCEIVFGELDVAGAYVDDVDDATRPRETLSKFVTGRAFPSSIPMLLRSCHIRRFELGIPRLPALNPDRNVGTSQAEAGDYDRARTIIGIIDDGCAFAHPAFLDRSGRTRLWFLWDQDERRKADTATLWRDLRGFGYGAELGYEELQRAAARAFGGDELAPYRQVDYLPVRPEPEAHAVSTQLDPIRITPAGTMLRATHGTGAMDLALGYPPPRRLQRAVHGDELTWPPGPYGVGAKPDFAENWPAVFVQLPTRTVLDTSGGSLGVHLLDGVRYILRRASIIESENARKTPLGTGTVTRPSDPTLTDPRPPMGTFHGTQIYPENNVVINISYGSIAGPHDGTSIIEEALADIVATRRNTWIVVSAGNSHRAGTHARLQIDADDSDHLLTWRIGPDNPQETFLEVWLPGVDVDGIQLSDETLARISVHLHPPGGLASVELTPGHLRLLAPGPAPSTQGAPPKGEIPIAGAMFARRVAQSRSGTMLLVAVAPTRRPLLGERAIRKPAPHGDWQVRVSMRKSGAGGAAARPLVVHAWTQRNDLLYGIRRPQQSSIVGDQQPPEPTEYSPEALSYQARFPCDRGTWSGTEPPQALQPDSAMGSLGSVAPVRDKIWETPRISEELGNERMPGGVVVVGGRRLADGEMSSYSSGGPARASEHDAGAARRLPSGARSPPVSGTLTSQCKPVVAPSQWRVQPDIDAPADIGTALRGLRVAGTRAGMVARISGTSAAAPQAARLIANYRYQLALDAELANPEARANANLPLKEPGATEAFSAGRPTPTPLTDDLYRKGHRGLL
jgi:hypothetical protein